MEDMFNSYLNSVLFHCFNIGSIIQLDSKINTSTIFIVFSVCKAAHMLLTGDNQRQTAIYNVCLAVIRTGV